MKETRFETKCIQAGYVPGNGEPRQIPIVQSICEGGDNGKPVALDSNSIVGKAFQDLAKAVVEATARRNSEKPATEAVKMQH